MGSVEIVGAVIGTLLGIAGISALAGLAYAQFKKGGRDYVREENKDLITRLQTLELNLAESDKKITELEKQVKKLSEQKNDVESLIIKALEYFFENNPETAIKMKNKLDTCSPQ